MVLVIAVARRLTGHVCYSLPLGGSRLSSHPPPVTGFTGAGGPPDGVHGGWKHKKTNKSTTVDHHAARRRRRRRIPLAEEA